MKFMNLGRSGLSVSRLCLGTMNFGPETDEATAHAVMDAALAGGINFFDTANRYGAPQHGRTEEIMGRWFAKGGGGVVARRLFGGQPCPTVGTIQALGRRVDWPRAVLDAQGINDVQWKSSALGFMSAVTLRTRTWSKRHPRRSQGGQSCWRDWSRQSPRGYGLADLEADLERWVVRVQVGQ